MTISCLIIDDEPLARKRLYNLVAQRPELNYIGEAQTGKLAIDMINELQPELLFLDIKMKDMTGFDVLKGISVVPPLIVFVTAFNEYAVKAFDLFAFDYLLKPYKKERFNASVDRVIKYKKNENQSEFNDKLNTLLERVDTSSKKEKHNSFSNKLAVKTGKSVSFIDANSIKYIKASGSYVDIFTSEKSHVLRDSLNEILQDLKNSNFCRIHRSTVINISFIDKLMHSNYGEIDVKMTDGERFRIGSSYKKEFLKIVGLK